MLHFLCVALLLAVARATSTIELLDSGDAVLYNERCNVVISKYTLYSTKENLVVQLTTELDCGRFKNPKILDDNLAIYNVTDCLNDDAGCQQHWYFLAPSVANNTLDGTLAVQVDSNGEKMDLQFVFEIPLVNSFGNDLVRSMLVVNDLPYVETNVSSGDTICVMLRAGRTIGITKAVVCGSNTIDMIASEVGGSSCDDTIDDIISTVIYDAERNYYSSYFETEIAQQDGQTSICFNSAKFSLLSQLVDVSFEFPKLKSRDLMTLGWGVQHSYTVVCTENYEFDLDHHKCVLSTHHGIGYWAFAFLFLGIIGCVILWAVASGTMCHWKEYELDEPAEEPQMSTDEAGDMIESLVKQNKVVRFRERVLLDPDMVKLK